MGPSEKGATTIGTGLEEKESKKERKKKQKERKRTDNMWQRPSSIDKFSRSKYESEHYLQYSRGHLVYYGSILVY